MKASARSAAGWRRPRRIGRRSSADEHAAHRRAGGGRSRGHAAEGGRHHRAHRAVSARTTRTSLSTQRKPAALAGTRGNPESAQGARIRAAIRSRATCFTKPLRRQDLRSTRPSTWASPLTKASCSACANQVLGLFTALGLITICTSAIVMWWRRRPEGSLGVAAPSEYRISISAAGSRRASWCWASRCRCSVFP